MLLKSKNKSRILKISLPFLMVVGALAISPSISVNAVGRDIPRVTSGESARLSASLFDAVEHDDDLRVRSLIAQGADVNVGDPRNENMAALHVAAKRGNVNVVNALLGAPGVNIELLDLLHRTPLHCAVNEGRTEVVRILLSHGALVDTIDSTESTALHDAAMNGSYDIVEALLNAGANIEAHNNEYDTPLTFAIRYGDAEGITARILLERGARVDEPGASENTPLHEAALNGDAALIRELINRGADVNALNDINSTPLLLDTMYDDVSEDDCYAVAEILLDHGADPTIANDEGNTPLHGAVMRNRLRIVELLLEHGARLNAVNNDGETPASLATSPEMRRFLHNFTQRVDMANR